MSKKTVLITGCSEGGIGSSLALEWHNQGYRVFATARRLEAMETLAKAGIELLAMDVTDPESLRKTAEQVSEKTGGTLDVLVNNAGQGMHYEIGLIQGIRCRYLMWISISQRKCTMSMSLASLERLRRFLPSLSQRKEPSSSLVQ
jgi:NAD(P)-dependent dehydrogenase (short-subunit alcohol dehydrogenase family)